jgi:hypothetical protein
MSIGVNTAQSWLIDAASMLNCKLGHIPFLYPGLRLVVMQNDILFCLILLIKFVVNYLFGKVVTYLWVVDWFYSNHFCPQFRFTSFSSSRL